MCGYVSVWERISFKDVFSYLSQSEMCYETTSKVCVSFFSLMLWYVFREACIHAYVLSASSQFRSQAMTADCGTIVLMLIEYSMWSFHECLLAQLLWYCIKM